jgi:hypothetical protein
MYLNGLRGSEAWEVMKMDFALDGHKAGWSHFEGHDRSALHIHT